MMNEETIRGWIRKGMEQAVFSAAQKAQSIAHTAAGLEIEARKEGVIYEHQSFDDTPTYVTNGTIPIEDGSAGILDVTAIGLNNTKTLAYTYAYKQAYRKFGGVLTVNVATETQSLTNDFTPDILSVSLVADSNDIAIEVTGDPTEIINWRIWVITKKVT